ncbi:hypothetical protein Q4543_12365 [Salipiger sp. 1_MG-2023]|uniref:hypothetical protein n=1 Tax=Salipiger sp. 1_MG-2023 TaxID=3062665 RepID=UPI0026E222A9|nr:hypothetical protein [Salipiger sp. 1_MG-2023]MDO6586308.1 hypothetical protein [Salipiger sp. 1_MG-2023]
MPNPLAYLMLAIWPVVTIALFRRLPAERALIAALMVGYLFLPEPPAAFDLPLMPPLNKHNIPALSASAFCLWKYGPQGPGGSTMLPGSLLGKLLLAAFIFSPIFTALGNTEPVVWGSIGLPALGIKDALALIVQQFLLILPFLLARQYLTSGGAQRYFLLALMIGGLVYSLPMLIEMRLSPQLNNWIYGYYQHLFGQSIRDGGYRPVVFLYHGLWVAFFVFTSAVAAFALWRLDARMHNFKILGAALYLTAILVLSRSLGALIFAVALIPMVLLFTRQMQIKVAILIGLLAIGYPILKGAHLVPEERILAAAASVSQERAYSLEFRFDNENTLLERAYEKPVFGWGSWGRNHILDPISGFILTVTDGRWIILIGIYGWVGFLAEFGLLVLPLVLLWREAVLAKEDEISPFIAPLSLMLAINVFDMIPNATLTPLTWLLAGALTGYAEQLKAARLGRGLDAGKALSWRSVM